MKFQSKFIHFHSWKCTWRWHLRSGVHFVSASMCYCIKSGCSGWYTSIMIPPGFLSFHLYNKHISLQGSTIPRGKRSQTLVTISLRIHPLTICKSSQGIDSHLLPDCKTDFCLSWKNWDNISSFYQYLLWFCRWYIWCIMYCWLEHGVMWCGDSLTVEYWKIFVFVFWSFTQSWADLGLTHKHLEIDGCVLSTVATDALVLKHWNTIQCIRPLCYKKHYIYSKQLKKIKYNLDKKNKK